MQSLENLFFEEKPLAMYSGPGCINCFSSASMNTSGDVCELEYVTCEVIFSEKQNKMIFLHILFNHLMFVLEVLTSQVLFLQVLYMPGSRKHLQFYIYCLFNTVFHSSSLHPHISSPPSLSP